MPLVGAFLVAFPVFSRKQELFRSHRFFYIDNRRNFPMKKKNIFKKALPLAAVLSLAITACTDSTSVNSPEDPQSPDAVASSSSESTKSSAIPEESSSSDAGPVSPGDSYTDTRDGKTYKLTKIGPQTWMAEDLNFGDSSLYTFADAQAVCPEGFHLPTVEELKTLVELAGGADIAAQKLKSTTGWPNDEYGNWNGTDDFGFNAKPVKSGDGTGTDENFWSSTRHFGDFRTGEFLKFDPHPTSQKDPESSSSRIYDPFCLGTNRKTTSSSLACFINGEPDTKLSVRCLSNIEDCGGATIDNTSQFCQDGVAYDICRGRHYDGTKYECRNDTLYERASGSIYKFSWIWLNSEKEYGLYLDKRDNQIYKTIEIDGVTWFAENLNYASEGSRCYMDDQFYCDLYGRMYTHKMALNGVKNENADKIQGLCPEGTHLATHAEMEALYEGREYEDDLFSEYHENDYDDVYAGDKNSTGISFNTAGTYYDSPSYTPDDLNRGGLLIGADYTQEVSHNYYFRDKGFSFADIKNPNDVTYGSVRCIVD